MHPRSLHLCTLRLSLFALVPCGCPMDDDAAAGTTTAAESIGSDSSDGVSTEPASTGGSASTSSSSDDAGSSSTGAAAYTVSGVVTRLATAPIAEGNDGIGTLYIGAFLACGHGEPPIGVFALPGADFSSEANAVPWSIGGLPAGTVHFGLFLDDDGDAVLPAAEPDAGDPSYADDVCDGVLSCMSFVIEDADVLDAALVLNTTHTECP
ncbi:MAG: hypothetical protein JNK45_01935 [Myxococcales bacterium]|nr:hypothetical protein [Myxococcales bacterium]